MSIGLMYIYYYISQKDIKNIKIKSKNNQSNKHKPYNSIKQNIN